MNSKMVFKIRFRFSQLLWCSALSCFTMGCHPHSQELEPHIFYVPQQRFVEQLCPAFAPLNPEELCQDWGKELHIGIAFAREMDLYRALTSFKRAQILMLPGNSRELQLQYNILFCYYLGSKFCEAIEIFETSNLINAPEDFPALQDMIILLYDAYQQVGRPEKAYRLLSLLAVYNNETAANLALETAITNGDMGSTSLIAENHPLQESVHSFLSAYQSREKSVKKAQVLNAILPGAGFYYVGQKKTALTSFLINSLFIVAAYQFFDRGDIAAGIITTSFELGWYFGGINGAGLAAKEYNEQLYSALGKELMIQNRLFPILMFQKGF